MIRSCLVAVFVMVFVVGCGGKYSSPTKTFETGWAAAQKGDRPGVMACYTEASRAGIKRLESTRAEMGEMPNIPKSLVDVIIAEAKKGTHRIVQETVDGSNASLKIAINEKEAVYRFKKEDGDWRIDATKEIAKMQKGLEFLKGLQDAGRRRRR